MHPKDLKYSTSHEWVKADGDTATVGITDHAQSELGDVVYVELPSLGAKLREGEVFGSVESVKTVSDLIAPVSGDVVEVHSELPDAPEAVNNSPYEEGWMVKVKLANPAEVDSLMTGEQYETFIQEH
ncbi:MAG: glycine cleavage system protein GcvH [Armatimonadota bacterium]